MSKINDDSKEKDIYKESKDKKTISKDEEEINEIIKDHSFYLKCEEYAIYNLKMN